MEGSRKLIRDEDGCSAAVEATAEEVEVVVVDEDEEGGTTPPPTSMDPLTS